MSSNNYKKALSNLKFSTDNIKGSNTLIKLFCCLIIVVLICVIIGNYAFKNGHLTCDHYVFNTYLYVILAILLVFIIILLNDQTGIFNSLLNLMFSGNLVQSIISFIIFIIIIAGLTYALLKIDPSNILASNTVWLLLILSLGIILIPTIILGRLTDVVGIAGIATLAITVLVGLLGYYFGDKIVTFNWDFYLNIALFGLIILIFISPLFITSIEGMLSFFYIISIILLIIFILLLLSNHKQLKENADKCIDGQSVPNYPVESYGLFLKIINIFKELINILAIRKLRK